MKTRTGFVSNSSSSSFIAYGYEVTLKDDAIDLIARIKPEILFEMFPSDNNDTTFEYIKNNDDITISDICNDIPSHFPLEVLWISDDESAIFGSYATCIEDEQGSNQLHNQNKVATILSNVGYTPAVFYGSYE